MIQLDSQRYTLNPKSCFLAENEILEYPRVRAPLPPSYCRRQDQYPPTLCTDLPWPDIQICALGYRSLHLNILHNIDNPYVTPMQASQ